ncbi:hypothetical protein FKV24_003925 [Lysobacter maris]|uniref:Rap1a immunity protein domain-containing protein n=1 Tax=Marilutibacter maris TaxID=1605891 RepID=A0A508B0C1_9GAMM|nr:hypothetical protein [Lysobacter maris]KAB8197002.1 hypothetical protein FKV24_003925 [Lysobacter maris]
MLAVILAFALSVGPAPAEASWRPAGCGVASRMSQDEMRTAEDEASRGNIGASVSLECHHLAIGDESGAIGWLRQSAAWEPLTGLRYVRYLLSVGDKRSCLSAVELTRKYLTMDWLPDDVRREILAQNEKAYGCS